MPLSARYASSPEGQPAAAKREAIPCDNHPDKVGTPAMGRQLGKSQKAQACPKAGQNRRLHRYVDLRQRGGPLHRSAPHTFLFRPCTAHFSFGKTERGPRRAPRGGERRSKGAGAVFAAGGNGAERTLRRRQWGVHPAGPAPCGSRSPRGRRTAARITLAPLVAASQQIVGSNAEVVRHFHQSRHIRIMPAALIILVLASTDFKNSSHLCLCLARLLAQLSDPLCKIFHAPPLDLQFNFVYIVNAKLNYDFGDDSS